ETAGLQDGKLGAAVNLQIGVGILHGVHMGGLSGEIEQEVLTLDQVPHAVVIADVGDVNAQAVFQVRQVEPITAVLRDEAVEDGDLGAEFHQAACQVGADEAQAAGDKDASIAKLFRGHVLDAGDLG